MITNPPYLLVKSSKNYEPHMSFLGKPGVEIAAHNLLATTEEEGKKFKLGSIKDKEGGKLTNDEGYYITDTQKYTLKEIFDHYDLMAPPVVTSSKTFAYFYFKLKPEHAGASGGSRKLKKKTKKLKRK